MPGGDRTGPMGLGPGTGRTFGYCYGYDSPGYMGGPGRGMGRGLGFGRGMGRGMGFARGMGRGRGFGRGWDFAGGPYPGYYPTNTWMPAMSREDEIKLLKSESEALKRSQKEIEKRLGELEKEEGK